MLQQSTCLALKLWAEMGGSFERLDWLKKSRPIEMLVAVFSLIHGLSGSTIISFLSFLGPDTCRETVKRMLPNLLTRAVQVEVSV